jgi:glycosyltransferase involved in cell wall biosynthesis
MHSARQIDVTVLIPTKNEEITISSFLDWCHIGFQNASIEGEIVLMDSSTDRTPQIALAKGAKVINVEAQGLGVAYLKGKEHISGKYVILGDADCTYDFRNINPFLVKLNQGFDLVVGNRFKGTIEKSAMPIHHQYFGSPATSFIFKHALGIPTGDIHCGMRGLTKDLFLRLPFTELGWEYASEMIVSSRNLGSKICEIPIDFLKEPEGRISHQKRNGWLTPFKAGWGTLRVTASFSLDRLLFLPGIFLAVFGFALNFLMFFLGDPTLVKFGIGNLTSSIFMAVSLVGILTAGLACISHLIYYPNGRATKILANNQLVNFLFSSTVFFVLSLILSGTLLFDRWKNGIFTEISSASIDNIKYVGFFNLSISLLTGVTVTMICSFLANYMEKLRISNAR